MLEKGIIGSLIQDDCELIASIKKEYFSDERLSKLFEVIKHMDEQHLEVDMLSVAEKSIKIHEPMKLIADCCDMRLPKLTETHIQQLKMNYVVNKLPVVASELMKNLKTLDIRDSLDFIIENAASLRNLIDSNISDEGFMVPDHFKSIVQDAVFIPTGIDKIDDTINELKGGEVSIATGLTGEGKTVFVNQVAVNAVDKGYETMIINGELDKRVLVNNLYMMVVGDDREYLDKKLYNRKTIYEPNSVAQKALLEWHKDRLFIYNKGESKLKTDQELLEMLENKINKHGIKLAIIDNLMSIMSYGGQNIWTDEGNFTQSLVDIAARTGCHIVLVLHPNKSAERGKKFNVNQINGSGNIPNKAFNIFMIVREWKLDSECDGYIYVDKNRTWGDICKAKLYYNKGRRMFGEINDLGHVTTKRIDWKRFIKKEVAPWMNT